jgi:neurotransmitter:Na+ symporter, NSS family
MSHQREHWGSRIGFVLAAAGSAIGLGSLWKFPYVTGLNGGGLFVLLYLGANLFVCFPLFIGELIIGRLAQKGPVAAMDSLSTHSRNWKGVGWLAVLTSIIVYSYYAVVSGWTLNYVLLSLAQFTKGRTSDQIAAIFDVMAQSGSINVLWQALFLLLTAAVVFSGVRQGVERWARILMPLLFILLLGLFFYALTLPGFGEAVRFIFVPDPSRLTPSGVLEALGLAFFTASLGCGVILTYGSYMNPQDDIPSTSLTILVLTSLVALFAALMIFPIIFTFGFEPTQGPGLVFITLPVLFAKLPGTLILSTAFFILLVFTALTSTVSLLENLCANGMELFGWSRHRSVWLSTALVFVVGLPSAMAASGQIFPTWTVMYGHDFFVTVSGVWDRWFLPLTGLLISLFVGWVVPREERNLEFLRGTRWRWFLRPWLLLVRWLVPLCILLFILQATGIINMDYWFGARHGDGNT